MAKTKKVAMPKVAQTLSKEMKQVVEVMIQKALKPSHKQLSDLQKKLKALKMDKGATKRVKAKKAIKAVSKSKASSKAKPKKVKAKAKVNKKMMSQA